MYKLEVKFYKEPMEVKVFESLRELKDYLWNTHEFRELTRNKRFKEANSFDDLSEAIDRFYIEDKHGVGYQMWVSAQK